MAKEKCYLCGNRGELYDYDGKRLHFECCVKYREYRWIRESKLEKELNRLIFKQVKYV